MDYGHGDGPGVVGRDVTMSFTTWIKSVDILMFTVHFGTGFAIGISH